VRLKAGREPVTEIDLRSEALVRKRLAELTPDIPVIGEEEGGERGRELTWYCDPIDGTVNFMRGHPHFAVSLGVARDAEPWAGAVVAPALRLWWRGSLGDRAYRNEQPCRISPTSDLADAVITTGLPTRGGPSGLQRLGSLAPHVRDLRRCGSAAIELCMVADGTYDAYVSRALSAWDTCAGAAIVQAAGGRWETLDDLELAHNGTLRDPLLARLKGASAP
jgi:myo-inositol-1(or 4)-monophosphatase